MAIPELDLRRIQNWCETRVPEHARHRVRVTYQATNRHVTIYEAQNAGFGDGPDEWFETPAARLRYTARRKEWTVYWRDRNLDFHYYDLFEPSPFVADALACLDRDETHIFWG